MSLLTDSTRPRVGSLALQELLPHSIRATSSVRCDSRRQPSLRSVSCTCAHVRHKRRR